MTTNTDQEKRSLVRELNRAGWKQARAFYHNGEKFNCARIHKGEFQLGMCQRDWKTVQYETLNVLALS